MTVRVTDKRRRPAKAAKAAAKPPVQDPPPMPIGDDTYVLSDEDEAKSVPPPWWGVFVSIDAERHRQVDKWGEQHHPDATGGRFFDGWAKHYQKVNDARAKNGNPIWSSILLEEIFEALAEKDPKRLRSELVQSAAVITAWIEDLDSRADATASTKA